MRTRKELFKFVRIEAEVCIRRRRCAWRLGGHQRINLTIDQVPVDRDRRRSHRIDDRAGGEAREEEHKNNYNFKAASDNDGDGGDDDDDYQVLSSTVEVSSVMPSFKAPGAGM